MSSRSIMGFDYGTKSIGVAIGQELTGTAQPLRSLKANDGIPNWDEIEKLLKEWQPDLLIVGLPLNMDGTDQEITLRARKFGNRLHGRFGSCTARGACFCHPTRTTPPMTPRPDLACPHPTHARADSRPARPAPSRPA